MSEVSRKDLVLKTMRLVHKQYLNNVHTNEMSKCALCREFRTDTYHCCSACPMDLFEERSYVPCMSRRCYPIDCNAVFTGDDIKRLKRVIKFYEQAIARIESMSPDEVLKTNYEFLITLDNEIAESFNIPENL